MITVENLSIITAFGLGKYTRAIAFQTLIFDTSIKSDSMKILERHARITTFLLAETLLVFLILPAAAKFLWQTEIGFTGWLLYAPVLLMQAFWLDRLYIVGHEATHRKLFPDNRRLNDLVGTLMLMPLAVPLQVFRKIHQFHHGFNRRDVHTSALDVFVSDAPVSRSKSFLYKTAWFVGVFGSGYFWHSFVSIVIFLFVPTRYAARISPAFKHWTSRDRVVSWVQFLLGVSFHLTIYFVGGFSFWLISLGLPILVFSWIYSLLVYIFHYDTSIGADVRFNARSLERNWFFSWLLMNFNEHATHHAFPNIPWYELPEKRQPLPKKFSSNQKVQTIWQAVLQQLKGPKIVYDNQTAPGAERR